MSASPEQHDALMMALGEIQATLDGIALDTQALREAAWGQESLCPPPWINAVQGEAFVRGSVDTVEPRYGFVPPGDENGRNELLRARLDETSERVATPGELEHLRKERDAGDALGYVMLAAVASSLATILFLLWVIGS